eukprot:882662-Rhodomonas_salina.3
MDFVGPCQVAGAGNNCLLTIIDYATRVARFIPCKSTQEEPMSAEATARLYFDCIFRRHELPAVLRTDRGSQFTGEFFREVFRLCGTRQALGTAHHPQSQGLAENANLTGIRGF